jgi:hypothetical protein
MPRIHSSLFWCDGAFPRDTFSHDIFPPDNFPRQNKAYFDVESAPNKYVSCHFQQLNYDPGLLGDHPAGRGGQEEVRRGVLHPVPGHERRLAEVQHEDGAEQRADGEPRHLQPDEVHRVRGLPDAVLPEDRGPAVQLPTRPDPGGRSVGPAEQPGVNVIKRFFSSSMNMPIS